MSDKIQPAMTAEEWNDALSNHYCPMPLTPDEEYDLSERPHPTAALALYGQPFGFTREDAAMCRAAYHDYVVFARFAQDRGDERQRQGFRAVAERFYLLADRIEALLPPVTPDQLANAVESAFRNAIDSNPS